MAWRRRLMETPRRTEPPRHEGRQRKQKQTKTREGKLKHHHMQGEEGRQRDNGRQQQTMTQEGAQSHHMKGDKRKQKGNKDKRETKEDQRKQKRKEASENARRQKEIEIQKGGHSYQPRCRHKAALRTTTVNCWGNSRIQRPQKVLARCPSKKPERPLMNPKRIISKNRTCKNKNLIGKIKSAKFGTASTNSRDNPAFLHLTKCLSTNLMNASPTNAPQ